MFVFTILARLVNAFFGRRKRPDPLDEPMRTEEHLASTVEDVTTAEETDVQPTNLRFVVPEPDEPETEATGPNDEQPASSSSSSKTSK